MFLMAILLGASLSTGAKADLLQPTIQLTVNMDIASCAKLLESLNAPSPADYAISDMEGAYVELLKDATALSSSDVRNKDRQMEIFLKKKADFLNRLNAVFPKLIYDHFANGEASIPLSQLVNMILSSGVATESYGIKLVDDSQISIDQRTYHSAMAMGAPRPQTLSTKSARKKRAIGFVELQGEEEEALPAHLHRSIGFHPFRIERHEDPKRKVGQLDFEMLADEKTLRVKDHQENTVHELSLEVLQTLVYETDSKKMGLTFDPREGWIVAFESLVNPDGVIGFRPN